jgi:hypothetical protein
MRTIINKLLLYLMIFSAIFWFGFNASKVFALVYIFNPETMEVKSQLSANYLKGFFYLFYPILVLSQSLYVFFISSSILYLLFGEKISFKKEGWALMILIILLICLPLEFYLFLLDYQINLEIQKFNDMNLEKVVSLVKDRFQKLSYFPFAQIFLHLSIIYLAVLKPLRKEKL